MPYHFIQKKISIAEKCYKLATKIWDEPLKIISALIQMHLLLLFGQKINYEVQAACFFLAYCFTN